MIRPTTQADTPYLLQLTEGTGVFKPHEIEALNEVLSDYHADAIEQGHVAVTFEEQGKILGYAYYAPAAMTDRTWYLYWIAVTRDVHAKGIGSKLLGHAENDIRSRGGRVLFIETSSLPHYELTRKFYLKHGYEITGVLRDYYSDGDDMVVFRKRIAVGNQQSAVSKDK
jgi:ribosomal protein S18 acetylase RimI-like enzyme